MQVLKSILRIGIFLITLAAPVATLAQNLSPASRRNILFTDLMNGMTISRPPSGLQGDIYLSERWGLVSVTLYEKNQVIDGYFARYNIYFDELDFQTSDGVRALGGSQIKSFEFKDTIPMRFINSRDYNLEGVPIRGFFQVMADGPAPLFKHHYLVIKDPDYNPAVNAGSRDTRITKYHKVYYAQGKEIIEVKGKKKLLASFGDKASDVEQYMKANMLYASDENDLIKIFEYYNTLLQ